MSLTSDITAVVNDILGQDFVGDVPASGISTLSPANIGNSGWTKFSLSGGGDCILTPTNSIDGILFKLVVAGNIHIITDYSGTTGRIKVTLGSGSGTEVYHSTQQSIGDNAFYEEVLLFWGSISGDNHIAELLNFNTTSTLAGTFSPSSGTPSFYISGGFDYTGSATYSASNNFTLTEFRLVAA